EPSGPPPVWRQSPRRKYGRICLHSIVRRPLSPYAMANLKTSILSPNGGSSSEVVRNLCQGWAEEGFQDFNQAGRADARSARGGSGMVGRVARWYSDPYISRRGISRTDKRSLFRNRFRLHRAAPIWPGLQLQIQGLRNQSTLAGCRH